MRNIKYIVIHCTAGFAPPDKVQDYFLRPKSKGGRGWNTGGYHIIVAQDGSLHIMYDFGKVTNGVKGFNQESIHISYVGGVRKEGGKFIAEDTRTPEQKEGIVRAIEMARNYLSQNGVDLSTGIQVLGHRDFSDDKNSNGVIEPWERIKDCPSFDAITEYEKYSSPDMCGLLPN